MSLNEKLKKLEKLLIPRPKQEVVFYVVPEGEGNMPLPFDDTLENKNLIVVAFSL